MKLFVFYFPTIVQDHREFQFCALLTYDSYIDLIQNVKDVCVYISNIIFLITSYTTRVIYWFKVVKNSDSNATNLKYGARFDIYNIKFDLYTGYIILNPARTRNVVKKIVHYLVSTRFFFMVILKFHLNTPFLLNPQSGFL